ncbi:MAG TPA: dihydrodipicolinate synthase family protein [Terriglobales bacterium]|jgi:dihydrodipicolinate synthase/N-acetylneuraminate lyase|nr:dihydrodipicolinate synthase family protein [Terriglobales bacterium]
MDLRDELRKGLVIPAHPLALSRNRKLDELHQRALTRYYLAAGAGGVAVGVHTTQFEIRDPKFNLLKPVLELAMQELRGQPVVKVAGVCGKKAAAITEAELAKSLGYDAALLSLAALRAATVSELLDHSRAIASIIPLIGFYLQPAVGGRVLPVEFWREFAQIPEVVAIKIAPFNRYQTLDVVRAVVESGRDDLALYTGNDDNIICDLLTRFEVGGKRARIVGGLLGHWAIWTKTAVSLLRSIKQCDRSISPDLLTTAQQVTEMNAAIFDPQNNFHGCISGINEVLRRQGLMSGRWCLDPREDLSPNQSEEIDRVLRLYPHLHDGDDALIREHLEEWLR